MNCSNVNLTVIDGKSFCKCTDVASRADVVPTAEKDTDITAIDGKSC